MSLCDPHPEYIEGFEAAKRLLLPLGPTITPQQRESQRVALLLCYVCYQHDMQPKLDWLITANNAHGNVGLLNDMTTTLCRMLQNLSSEDFEKYVYDGHSRWSRRLADWWEGQQKLEQQRGTTNE